MRTSYDDEYVRHWRETLEDLQLLIGELEKIAAWEAACDAHMKDRSNLTAPTTRRR